mmetsp:Transcript_9528/g.17855  ORF Transcript_9528/g.17855 Transcript_9528/m.17855 type:complete len:93 (-) Transcript_9528:973-1251(-)
MDMHTKINMQVMFTTFIIVSECKYLSCVSGSTNTTMNAVKTMKHRPLVTFTSFEKNQYMFEAATSIWEDKFSRIVKFTMNITEYMAKGDLLR